MSYSDQLRDALYSVGNLGIAYKPDRQCGSTTQIIDYVVKRLVYDQKISIWIISVFESPKKLIESALSNYLPKETITWSGAGDVISIKHNGNSCNFNRASHIQLQSLTDQNFPKARRADDIIFTDMEYIIDSRYDSTDDRFYVSHKKKTPVDAGWSVVFDIAQVERIVTYSENKNSHFTVEVQPIDDNPIQIDPNSGLLLQGAKIVDLENSQLVSSNWSRGYR